MYKFIFKTLFVLMCMIAAMASMALANMTSVKAYSGTAKIEQGSPPTAQALSIFMPTLQIATTPAKIDKENSALNEGVGNTSPAASNTNSQIANARTAAATINTNNNYVAYYRSPTSLIVPMVASNNNRTNNAPASIFSRRHTGHASLSLVANLSNNTTILMTTTLASNMNNGIGETADANLA